MSNPPNLYLDRRGGFRAAKGFKKGMADKLMRPEEFEALLTASAEDDGPHSLVSYALFALSGNFGLRCTEAINLTFSDFASVHFGYFTVQTLKKKASQQDRVYIGRKGIPMVDAILEERRGAVKKEDGLFSFGSRFARYLFAYYAKLAGISNNVSFHSLRHTAAKMMHTATGDMRIVNAFLRHRPTSTEIYVYPSADEMSTAMDKKGVIR